MHTPEYRNKSADEIIAINIELDSATYFYIAACWHDLYLRNGKFPILMNAAIHARMGIEYLFFEEIVLSCEQGLTDEEYQKCLKDGGKLSKTLNKLQPDYVKLKEFTNAFARLEPTAPNLIIWDIKALLKQWGNLSNILHWSGAFVYTTCSDEWLIKTENKIGSIIRSLWTKTISGKSGFMNIKDMKPEVKLIWEDFKAGNMDAESVTKRLDIMRPIIETQNI